MLTSPDRRNLLERRRQDLIPYRESAAAHRRFGERRDCARVRRAIQVAVQGQWKPVEHREAMLSLGGASWTGAPLPLGTVVEVSFRLPEVAEEISLLARVDRTWDGAPAGEVQATFLELPVKTELALARFVESRARLEASLQDRL